MWHVSSLRLMAATLDDLLSSVQHRRRDLGNSRFCISIRYRRLLCLLALILPYPFLVSAWLFFRANIRLCWFLFTLLDTVGFSLAVRTP
jgi:hypothetical protein